jgi:hypothetical protein
MLSQMVKHSLELVPVNVQVRQPLGNMAHGHLLCFCPQSTVPIKLPALGRLGLNGILCAAILKLLGKPLRREALKKL